MRHLVIGLATTSLLLLNTLVGILPMMVFALCKLLIPIKPVQHFCFEAVRWIASNWASVNALIFAWLTPVQWEVRGQQDLRRDHSLLVVSNHQSWVDIPALMAAIHGKAPFFTFFLKRELIWVPLLGLAWWALEYPFMRRFSAEQLRRRPDLKGKDLEITQKACQRLQGRPVSLVNYLEGTRFTPAKQKQQNSPYRYLLKPKSGGMAFTLKAMGRQLTRLLDVTVVYTSATPPTFWALLSGQVKRVIIDLRELDIPQQWLEGDYQQDPQFRADFQAWVNQLWAEKDQLIAHIREQEGCDAA